MKALIINDIMFRGGVKTGAKSDKLGGKMNQK